MDTDFDFTTAKSVAEAPALQRLRQAHARSQKSTKQAFDDDVIAWVERQDAPTQRHINDVIRHFMAVKA